MADSGTPACFHSQLDGSQELEEVSAVHVVQVEQQVLAVSGQFNSSQLWEVRQQTMTVGLHHFGAALIYYGAAVRMIVTVTLSRMWMFVRYSEGTWKSAKATRT